MSTTPFVPGCTPWLHEALDPAAPEPPALPLAPSAGALLAGALLAGAPVAAPVPGWLAAPVLLPDEPQPAMVAATVVSSSAAPERAAFVRDI
jgi:hypothetical protein